MGKAGKRKIRWQVVFLLSGCQPATPREDPCLTSAPTETTVGAWCSDGAIEGGEGGNGDTLITTPIARAVIRHPQSALTAPGLGGGTLVDLGGWEQEDNIDEILPLVGGGWLTVDAFEATAAGIQVGGTALALPNQPEIDPLPFSVTWTAADDQFCAEGADSLYIRERGSGEKIGDLWFGEHGVLHFGPTQEFLSDGWIAEGSCISWFPPTQPWKEGVLLSGTAVGAEAIELLAAGERVGWVRVIDGAFESPIPADVDAVRATASGFRPSEWHDPGEGLALALGGTATVTIATWGERPVRVAWTNDADQTGVSWVPVGGGQLTLGEGRYRLSFSAGPDANAQPQHIVASGNAFVRAPLQTEDVVWASLGWDRSVSRAIGAGLTYAVFTPENDVSQQGESAWIPFAKAGVETTGPGYRIWAWPLNATRRKSGHGAPDARNLSPEQALGLLLGTGTGRYAAVDLGWLELATEIPSPAPDFVMLDLPTEPTLDWKPWWDALEAGMVLQPAGPWNGLFLPDAYGEAEVERALLEGHSFASNGPRLRVVPSFPGGPKTLEVSGITSGTGQWIGSGGEVLHEWTLPSTAPPLQLRRREWAVAVVWNSTLWAASAPQYAQ